MTIDEINEDIKTRDYILKAHGNVNGNVKAKTVVIYGNINGNVTADEVLLINGKVTGNVKANTAIGMEGKQKKTEEIENCLSCEYYNPKTLYDDTWFCLHDFPLYHTKTNMKICEKYKMKAICK